MDRVELTADNRTMLFILEGFAHGFQTLCDNTYVNSVRTAHELELTPGTAVVDYLFPLDAARMWTYKILYYAIMFVPMGLLWSRSVTRLSKGVPIQTLVMSGGMLFSSLLLESLLVRVSGQTVQWDNLLFSLIFMVAPVVLVKLARYFSLSRMCG